MKKSLVFIIITAIVLFAFATPLFAFTTKSDETVNITENIEDDVYLTGNTVNVSGSINGDLVAAGGRLNITGAVSEDIIAAGGELDFSGAVMDDIRAAGGSIRIDSKVADDAIIAGGMLTVDSEALIGGDLVINGARILIGGNVAGKVIASGGSIVISGKVANGVDIGNVESLEITNTAEIIGDITYSSAKEADIAPGAKISGDVKFNKIEEPAKDVKLKSALVPLGVSGGMLGGILGGMLGAAYIIGNIVSFLSLFVLGILLLLGIPSIFKKFNERMRRSFGYCTAGGAITLFGIPIAVLILWMIGFILLLTLAGAGLGIITFASTAIILIVYAITIYASTAFLSYLLGTVILSKSKLDLGKYKFKVLAYLIGLAIIMLAYSIPVAGGFMMFAGIIFGLGGIAMVIKDWLFSMKSKK